MCTSCCSEDVHNDAHFRLVDRYWEKCTFGMILYEPASFKASAGLLNPYLSRLNFTECMVNLLWYGISDTSHRLVSMALQTESCHYAKFAVTGGTASCRNDNLRHAGCRIDNLRCHQLSPWRFSVDDRWWLGFYSAPSFYSPLYIDIMTL